MLPRSQIRNGSSSTGICEPWSRCWPGHPKPESHRSQASHVRLWGGWFGEPENQLAVIEHLKLKNVGIVYNLHHGHGHIDDFAAALARMKPYLLCLNLNGMTRDGERRGPDAPFRRALGRDDEAR